MVSARGFHCCGLGLIPGQGTKTLTASSVAQIKLVRTNYYYYFFKETSEFTKIEGFKLNIKKLMLLLYIINEQSENKLIPLKIE